MKQITGVVLCGGRGVRMQGADKALLTVDGETLLARILARLEPQVDRVLLSCNSEIATYERYGAVVQDTRADAGPLAGIEAALKSATTEFLFACPGDCPALPSTIVDRLHAAIDGGLAAVAHDGRRVQNLLLLLRRDCLPNLSAWLDGGGRRVDAWLDRIGAAIVPCGDFAESFANINTPEDLANWKARMRR